MFSFNGLTENDFEHLRGSSWRGRHALGGALATTISSQTGQSYQSWGVTRRLELHIAAKLAYNFEDAQRYAKLFVYTHSNLAVGFYIEPSDKYEDGEPIHQHWMNFRDRIQRYPAMLAALISPMINHGLVLTNYYEKDASGGILQGAYAYNAGRLEFWQPESQTWADTHVNYMLQQITGIHTENPTHLHLFTQIEQKSAINMGKDVIHPILDVLRALLPLYEMTIE